MGRLLKEFNVKEYSNNYSDVDYLAFEDKDLLDKFRKDILQRFSDKYFTDEIISTEIINREIDNVTYGYSLSNKERVYLFNLIDCEVNGIGPLTELLNDDNITEIMVNGPDQVYIEIDGNLKKDDSVSFINDEHIIRTIDRLLESTGKVIDVNRPMVDAVLKDGSRINAIIPPLVLTPSITIRKFKRNIVTMDDLVGNGSLTPYMARFLEAAVKAKLNILVCGSSGAGKTTVLNILSEFIPNSERIITIEDIRELKLKQSNIVSLETRGADYNGLGEITTSDLVDNVMRMRPDRIIIGEIMGREAFAFLQAMNTGHDGALSSIHANGCLDALNRLETMVLMNGLDVPMQAMHEYINNAIDIVVHISRMKDGRRKIVDISEVKEVVNNEIHLENIFEFKRDNNSVDEVKGEFILREYKPQVLKKIKLSGDNSLDEMFNFKKSKK